MVRAADARRRRRTRGSWCRRRSPAARVADLAFQLFDGFRHRDRFGRKQLVGGPPLPVEVDRKRLVDRVANDGGHRCLSRPSRGGETAVTPFVKEDLQPALKHEHTLACAGRVRSYAASGGASAKRPTESARRDRKST